MDLSPFCILCPAKVNLALSVGSAGEDGYHPIASWMVKVNLFDDLVVEPLADPRAPSTFQIGWADDALQPTAVDWPVERDLTCLACQVVEQSVGRPLPVAVKLAKRIPTGAGLGGGSSDGAGMLRALDELFNLRLSQERLVQFAHYLGSDVPFFLAPTSALVEGLGQTIEPMPMDKPLDMVLILPGLHCPTGGVYKMFDQICPKGSLKASAVRELAEGKTLSNSGPFNDLAQAACALVPELAQIQARCANVLAMPVHITGSGAGMFAVAASPEEARALADRVKDQLGVEALAVRTL